MAHAATSTSFPSGDASVDPQGSVKPPTDPVSDNEANEKSARDQLRKTSLAASSQATAKRLEMEENSRQAPGDSSKPDDSVPSTSAQGSRAESPRGRLLRKRSYDRSETPSSEPGAAQVSASDAPNGHSRKKSRDVRSGETSRANSRAVKALGEIVQEESDKESEEDDSMNTSHSEGRMQASTGASGTNEISDDAQFRRAGTSQEGDSMIESTPLPKETHNNTTADKNPISNDLEMKDGAGSPRRKRSREQMDTDANREQKIAATEIARAQRRSDEITRNEVQTENAVEGREIRSRSPDKLSGARDNTAQPSKSQSPQPHGFGQISALKGAADPSGSSGKPKPDASTDLKPASASAFASSGFAALANTSSSPFGTLGGSKSNLGPSPFGASNPSSSSVLGGTKPASGLKGGFGSVSQPPASQPAKSDASPFAAAGLSKGTGFGGSTFGGSAFGGGFGSGFGSGSKLTSFAAPQGDAKFIRSNGTINPIGSPGDTEDQTEESDGGEDSSLVKGKNDEADETDERFQHQDVETGEDGEESIFSTRASLYTYKEGNWREAGKGVFKLNVSSSSTDEGTEKSDSVGRFIMRAHQTYRVLVNAPIMSQMKMGDSKGDEPTGKHFLFAVLDEDRKPTPHMLKLSDANESKALYKAVTKLQQGERKTSQGGEGGDEGTATP